MVVLCFVVAAWYLWRDGRAGAGEGQAEPQLAAAVQPSVPAPVVPGPAAVESGASAALVVPEPLSGGLPDAGVTTHPAVAAEKLTLPSEIRVSTNLITRAAVGEGSGGRDGVSGVVEESVPLPELRLQSIIFRSEAPMAMINGKTLVAGEKVLGVELLEIRRGSVLLRWQGSTQEMRLPDL
jgi:hypothetical protein